MPSKNSFVRRSLESDRSCGRDHCELTDVAAKHADVVARMDKQWRAMAQRTGKIDPEGRKKK